MDKDGIAIDLNSGNALEVFRNLQHEDHVPRFPLALRRQPDVGGFAEQIAVRNGLPSRNGKWSRAELKSPAKLAAFPWRMNATVGFFPIAYPGIILPIKDVKNQQSEARIAHRNERVFDLRTQQVSRIVTIFPPGACAKIQHPAFFCRCDWPLKVRIGLQQHLLAECFGTDLAVGCRHVEGCDVGFQEWWTERDVMIPRDGPIEGR